VNGDWFGVTVTAFVTSTK